jgi:hypothetical protein
VGAKDSPAAKPVKTVPTKQFTDAEKKRADEVYERNQNKLKNIVDKAEDKSKASDDNAYLKRSRAVTDAVKKTAGEFTKLRNYNPLAKLSDLAEGVSSRVSRFTKATPAEQAEKFRSRSMTAQNNMKAGGKVSSASKRADGCAVRGKTRA